MLGQQLIQSGLISKDQLRIALTEQKVSNKRLGSVLVDFGFVADEVLHEFFSRAKNIKLVELDNYCADKTAIVLVPKEVSERYKVVPIKYEGRTKTLILAVIDPENLVVTDGIRRTLNRAIKLVFVMARETSITRAQREYYGALHSFEMLVGELESVGNEKGEQGQDSNSGQTIIRLVNFILSDATMLKASDIHLEPESAYLRIRYRVDGVLTNVHSLHKKHWSAISIRLKVLAGLDITETRIPQDGRFSRTIYGSPTDFRVSTFPMIHGENTVLRILSRNKSVLALDQLGYDNATTTAVRNTLASPDGLVLVAGPTGSGKTTTLYSLINEINTSSVNIMTLEDPVEYPLVGVRQSSIKKGQQFNYVEGVKAILRQDPDIVLIGEIRDSDTAQIAIRAAMTGHKVFSTIHTKDAVSAIGRLAELGVRPNILSSNLHAVISQRLLRKSCSGCRNKMNSTASLCAVCNGIGYAGRFAIAEVLSIDVSIEEMISEQASKKQLLGKVHKNGWKSLRDIGLKRVTQGDTDFQEIRRVLGITKMDAEKKSHENV